MKNKIYNIWICDHKHCGATGPWKHALRIKAINEAQALQFAKEILITPLQLKVYGDIETYEQGD